MGLDVERSDRDRTLDISELKLTAEEIDSLAFDLDTWERRVADAATAKALWGLVGWFSAQGRDYYTEMADHMLEEALEAAGIPRPEETDEFGTPLSRNVFSKDAIVVVKDIDASQD